MVDIERSKSDLLTTLFQDGQVANSISEQDMRDFVVTAQGCYGGILITGAPTGQVVTSGTPIKINQFDTDVPSTSGITTTHTTDDITIDVAGVYLFTGMCSVGSSVNNTLVTLTYYVNGSPTGARAQSKVGTGNDISAIPTFAMITLAVNDVVTIYVDTDKNATVTLTDGCHICKLIG